MNILYLKLHLNMEPGDLLQNETNVHPKDPPFEEKLGTWNTTAKCPLPTLHHREHFLRFSVVPGWIHLRSLTATQGSSQTFCLFFPLNVPDCPLKTDL